MAKREFLHRLQGARRDFAGPLPPLSASDLDDTATDQRHRGAFWLTPATVRGFDPEDFPELAADDWDTLRRDVTEFTEIAEQAPATGPVPWELTRRALPPLLRILRTLRPYLPEPDDEMALRQAVNAAVWWDFHGDEAKLTGWTFEFGQDAYDKPGVWIDLILGDDVAMEPADRDYRLELGRRVEAAVQETDLPVWPFVSFRSASEEAERRASQTARFVTSAT